MEEINIINEILLWYVIGLGVAATLGIIISFIVLIKEHVLNK